MSKTYPKKLLKPLEEISNSRKEASPIAITIAKEVTIVTAGIFQFFTGVMLSLLTKNFFITLFLCFMDFMFFIIIPLLPLFILYLRKEVDIYRIQTGERSLILLTEIVEMVIFFFLLDLFARFFHIELLDHQFFVLVYLIVVIIDAFLTIGFKFRTSLHVSGATCSITALVLVLGITFPFFFLLYLFVPLIIWARWILKVHTLKEIISGLIIGLGVPILTFIVLSIASMLL